MVYYGRIATGTWQKAQGPKKNWGLRLIHYFGHIQTEIRFGVLLIYLLCKSVSPLSAQNNFTLSFSESTKEVSRNRTTTATYELKLNTPIVKADSFSYQIEVEVDRNTTTLNSGAFNLDFENQIVTEKKRGIKETFYLSLRADSVADRARTIVLNLRIKSEGNDISSQNGGQSVMVINVAPIKPPLSDTISSFSYLAYIGTNFDLVDGVKARNIFFATNIFVPSEERWGVGAYLSLYGNRTITATDSLSNVMRVKSIVSLNDSTAIQVSERANRVSSYYSDNIGAHYVPIFNMGKISDESRQIRFFLAPSVEFIWRRTHVNTYFSDGEGSDTLVVSQSLSSDQFMPERFQLSYNQFHFNTGIGFFLCHENKQISVRFYWATGLGMKYIPEVVGSSQYWVDVPYRKDSDAFFSGRLWITEHVSGLTLQAEITNTFKRPTPYYGVTLSKAITFNNLRNIFAPLSSR